MLDERACASPPPNPVAAPEQPPPQLAKGTSERGKEAVQSMLLAGAVAFARDPASLDILRPVGNAIDDRPRPAYRAPVATATQPLTVRKVVLAPAPALSGIRPETERALLAVLESAAQPGETIDAHGRRKERELGALFATASVFEARALHGRLSNPKPGDALATRFARMIVERRHRLLQFLADARRREAIHTARR